MLDQKNNAVFTDSKKTKKWKILIFENLNPEVRSLRAKLCLTAKIGELQALSYNSFIGARSHLGLSMLKIKMFTLGCDKRNPKEFVVRIHIIFLKYCLSFSFLTP